jgi:Na+/citrate or Na+/malate symporter
MSSIDFSKLFTLKYWLEGTTTSDYINVLPVEAGSIFFNLYLVAFCGTLITAIVLTTAKLFINGQNPLQPKFTFLSQNFAWMGILGLGWFGCRQTNIAFLGSRIWLLVWLIWGIVILGIFLKYLVKFYPLERSFFLKNKKSPTLEK